MELPVLDPSALAELKILMQRGNNPHLLKELIALYFQEGPAAVSSIHQALNQGDLRGVQKVAHFAKSMAANLGAVRVRSICEKLEHHPGPVEATRSLCQDLDSEMLSSLEELKKLSY